MSLLHAVGKLLRIANPAEAEACGGLLRKFFTIGGTIVLQYALCSRSLSAANHEEGYEEEAC